MVRRSGGKSEEECEEEESAGEVWGLAWVIVSVGITVVGIVSVWVGGLFRWRREYRERWFSGCGWEQPLRYELGKDPVLQQMVGQAEKETESQCHLAKSPESDPDFQNRPLESPILPWIVQIHLDYESQV
ncbi:hypothetical protein L6452_32592 [Arctium lappa]|uniref:Uncharacterized protein n=1 Tax=Arctium lappa TaxID=4217 RepID=A0ACB8Z695_ARCLA|nr:hypothetical protein L6452_32592 [Arctium lappa]